MRRLSCPAHRQASGQTCARALQPQLTYVLSRASSLDSLLVWVINWGSLPWPSALSSRRSYEGLFWRQADVRGPGGLTPMHLAALSPAAPALSRLLASLCAPGPAAWFLAAADDGLTPANFCERLGRPELNADMLQHAIATGAPPPPPPPPPSRAACLRAHSLHVLACRSLTPLNLPAPLSASAPPRAPLSHSPGASPRTEPAADRCSSCPRSSVQSGRRPSDRPACPPAAQARAPGWRRARSRRSARRTPRRAPPRGTPPCPSSCATAPRRRPPRQLRRAARRSPRPAAWPAGRARRGAAQTRARCAPGRARLRPRVQARHAVCGTPDPSYFKPSLILWAPGDCMFSSDCPACVYEKVIAGSRLSSRALGK